jgi:hypothetical protein
MVLEAEAKQLEAGATIDVTRSHQAQVVGRKRIQFPRQRSIDGPSTEHSVNAALAHSHFARHSSLLIA